MNDGCFQDVVDRHYEDLYRFAMSLARKPGDAWDLVQQTFETFARKGDQIRDPGKTKQWLFTTLYRQFTSAYRRDRMIVPLDDGESAAPPVTVDSEAETKLTHAEIRQALGELDERHRVVLTLHYLDDLSYREIAAALDIPIGTVMSRLSRGKANLRERIEKLFAPSGIDSVPFVSNRVNKDEHADG